MLPRIEMLEIKTKFLHAQGMGSIYELLVTCFHKSSFQMNQQYAVALSSVTFLQHII